MAGHDLASYFDRHERWGRLVKRAGMAGEFNSGNVPGVRSADRNENAHSYRDVTAAAEVRGRSMQAEQRSYEGCAARLVVKPYLRGLSGPAALWRIENFRPHVALPSWVVKSVEGQDRTVNC